MTVKHLLAVIPARLGSKRLIGKNKKPLGGKPLIQWTIEAALNCSSIDQTVVSTDDPEIQEIAKNIGADAPFLRPAELSTDSAPSESVVRHALDYYRDLGIDYQWVLLLQPTSPFRTTRHILEAIALAEKTEADAITSVCLCEHSPLWANTLNSDMCMDTFFPTNIKNLRSQELPNYYRLNGAIYLLKVRSLIDQKTLMLDENLYAYKMDTLDSIDIDTQLDFIVAEAILKQKSVQ